MLDWIKNDDGSLTCGNLNISVRTGGRYILSCNGERISKGSKTDMMVMAKSFAQAAEFLGSPISESESVQEQSPETLVEAPGLLQEAVEEPKPSETPIPASEAILDDPRPVVIDELPGEPCFFQEKAR